MSRLADQVNEVVFSVETARAKLVECEILLRSRPGMAEHLEENEPMLLDSAESMSIWVEDWIASVDILLESVRGHDDPPRR